MADDPLITETDSRFTSGEWFGFYLQPSVSRNRHRMDCCLTFQSGAFHGEGKDGVGEFLINGRYDLKSGEVTFHKHYVRQHSVFYRGWNEGKGIWGTWEISLGAGEFHFSDKGGFHIWPKGMADPTGEYLSAEERLTNEAEEVALVGEILSAQVSQVSEPTGIEIRGLRTIRVLTSDFGLGCESTPFTSAFADSRESLTPAGTIGGLARRYV